MGFFDKFKSKAPLKVNDQQLLIEAMLCVAFADGDDQLEETQLVRAFAYTLPEFKNADTYEVYEAAEKVVKLHGSLNRVKELQHLSSEALRHKAFLLAMDVALSSGEIDDGEEAVLAAMAETMRIPADVAEQIASVLMMKYAT
jgi:uncharacterized tellurite resistance protein B-like protein